MSRLFVIALAVTSSSACSDDTPERAADTRDAQVDGAEPEVDAEAEAETPAPPAPHATVRFELPATGLPQPLAIPFPSDLYRDGEGFSGRVSADLADWTLAGITQQSQVLRDAYTGLDGFGHTSGALFRIDFSDGAIGLDTKTLPTTGDACLAPNSPVAIVDVTDASARRLPCVASYFEPLHTLVIAPEGEPLRGGRRYAVLVRDSVVTDDGGHLGAAPGLSRLLAETSPAAALFSTALDRAASALEWPAASVAGLAVYSAHTEHRQLRVANDALTHGDYGPPPELRFGADATAPYASLRFCAVDQPGCSATLDAWLGTPLRDAQGRDVPGAPGEAGNPEPPTTGMPHDALGVVIQGAFEATEFRAPWAGTSAPDDGNIPFVGGVAQVQAAKTRLPITIVLPKSPAPATGYPVVIFSHGTPSNRQFAMTFANELARAGIATVTMDGLYHGVRSSAGADERNNYPGTYTGPDGFADLSETPAATIELSATLQSAARYRANLWQYALEWCELRRLIANPALDLTVAADQYPEGSAPRFDATKIGWLGTSFGAFTGALLLPVETDIRAFFLNVGNGDGLQWQGQSPINRAQITLVLMLFGMSEIPLTRFTPFVSIAFGALEPGFAAASAEDVPADGPDILMTEVEFDEFVPNRSTELLAQSLGIPQVVPAGRIVAGLDQSASPIIASAGRPARGLVHMGTASHSSNLGRRWGRRRFQFPEQLEDAVAAPFDPIAPPIWIRQPVVASQAMLVEFMTSAFAGVAVIDSSAIPRVIDFDGDGYCDTSEQSGDSDWRDPASHPAGPADCAWDVGY